MNGVAEEMISLASAWARANFSNRFTSPPAIAIVSQIIVPASMAES